MRKLLLILTGLWTAVFIYTYIFSATPAAGYDWLILFILIVFGMIGVCIVSGTIGFAKYRNPWPAAFVNAAGSAIIIIIIAGKDGDISRGIVFVGGGAFLITLGAAFISYLFDGKSTPRPKILQPVQLGKEETEESLSAGSVPSRKTPEQPKHPLPDKIRYPLIGGVFIGLYFLTAYCSQYKLFPAEKELFWKEITPEQYNFQFAEVPKDLQKDYMKDRYILDRNGNPFTGAIDRYKPQLRINPFPPTIKGVDYYINGEKWGESIEKYGVTVPFDYNTHQRIKRITLTESQPPYLIHAFYAENISRLLEKYAGEYIIRDTDNPLEKYLLGFDEEQNRILKTHIHYYTNGMISEIAYNYNMEFGDENRRPKRYSRIKMDRLGFIDSDSKYGVWDMKWEGTTWKRGDFTYTDTVPDPVQARVATGKTKEKLESLINELEGS